MKISEKNVFHIIDLCEKLLSVAYEIDNNKLEYIAHEIKATVELSLPESGGNRNESTL